VFDTVFNPVFKPTLGVEGVSVSYGTKRARVRALSDVSIEFEMGRLTLIMGPSGSGKTTLLSLLGCLISPDEGHVYVDGRDVKNLSEDARVRLRRRIGFVFQSFRLFHSLPALENVLLPAAIAGRRFGRANLARKLLQSVGLGDKLGMLPDQLSGGEKQKVAICRALFAEPQFLLADEPTASLDAEAARQVKNLLRKICDTEGRTMIVVSHDSRWISYADRVIVLEDGRIIGDGKDNKCEESSLSCQTVPV
jgi:putative ABC transport system ATP-binding protein